MSLWHRFGGSGFIIINKLQLSCVKVIFIFFIPLIASVPHVGFT